MTLHIYDDIVQGSTEWHDLRRGMVTASVVGQLVTTRTLGALDFECPACDARPGDPCRSKVKRAGQSGTPIKTLHSERSAVAAANQDGVLIIEPADDETSRGTTARLVAERVAGFTEDTPMTSDMWRGVDSEPLARDIYSGHYQQAVECGFMVREGDGWTLGYSPDGVVGVDGLIEIKAPRAKTHLRTILADEVPAYYMPQLQAGLLVSGRAWIDFVSYCGGMPMWVKRVTPDPRWFAAITAAVQQLETTAAEMTAAYDKAAKGLPATERANNNLGLVF